MTVVVDQPPPYPAPPGGPWPYPPPPGYALPPGYPPPYPGFPYQPPLAVFLPREGYTPWSKRMWAGLIDWTPIFLAFLGPMILNLIFASPGCFRDVYDSGSRRYYYGPRCPYDESDTWLLVSTGLLLLTVPYFLWNFCYRQGKTGQSIGKSALKFRVISEKTGQPIGFWRSLARQLVHYADQAICYIGYLFPLWDSKRQTFADKALSTVCIPVDPRVQAAP